MEKKNTQLYFSITCRISSHVVFSSLRDENKYDYLCIFYEKNKEAFFFILFEKAHHQPTYSRHALLQGKNNQRQHTQCLKKEKKLIMNSCMIARQRSKFLLKIFLTYTHSINRNIFF